MGSYGRGNFPEALTVSLFCFLHGTVTSPGQNRRLKQMLSF